MTQTAVRLLLFTLAAAAGAQRLPLGGTIAVTASDNVRLTMVNTGHATSAVCTVQAALVDVSIAPDPISPVIAAFDVRAADPVPDTPIGPVCTDDCPLSATPRASFDLPAGQTATLDYAPAPGTSERRQLRPTLTVSNGMSCSRLTGTIELIDAATARTTVIYPLVPNPIALGPAGITAADTLQVTVVFPPVPVARSGTCRVEAGILPLRSTTPIGQTTFSLTPGQAQSITYANPRLAAGVRQTVLPFVRRVSGDPACLAVQVGFELFDSATRRTIAVFPPVLVRGN